MNDLTMLGLSSPARITKLKFLLTLKFLIFTIRKLPSAISFFTANCDKNPMAMSSIRKFFSASVPPKRALIFKSTSFILGRLNSFVKTDSVPEPNSRKTRGIFFSSSTSI